MRPLIAPASIAVIGASPRPGHFANQPLVNLRANGFAGTVYPVNPKYERVEGMRCYPSVKELPAVPDLAVVVLKPALAVRAVADCAEVGVPAAVVVASGFAETGDPADVALQEQLSHIAAETDIRILGPNTLGIANFNDETVSLVSGNIPTRPIHGPIAIVSQSGGCGFTLLNRAWSLGIGVGHLAVAGNEVDVGIPELLAAYLHRDDVRVVLCYMEAVRDPVGLRQAAQIAHDVGKPVFVMKAGSTSQGQRAAAAHTGALAASDAVCDAAFRQWGLLRAGSFDTLVACGGLSSAYDPPSSGRLGVYAQGGGLAVVTADLFAQRGHHLPELQPDTVERIKRLMPDTSPGNPFDSGGRFLSQGVDVLVEALTTFASDLNIDATVYCLMPVAGHRLSVYADGIAQAVKSSPKPSIILQYRAGAITEEATEIFRASDALVLDPPEAGIEALGLWLESRHVKPSIPATVRSGSEIRDRAITLTRDWRQDGVTVADEYRASRLLNLYGVSVPSLGLATTADEAAALAPHQGRVVVKVVSPDISHRSDFGGVMLDVGGPEAVTRAFEIVTTRAREAFPNAAIEGVVVNDMAPQGLELIVGALVDPTFGPIVLVGLGGVLAEVLRDTSLRLAPLSVEDAEVMLGELRGAPLIFGYRGSLGIDVPALCNLLVAVGDLTIDLADHIRAVDLNPVIAYGPGSGLKVVDALVELSPSSA